jgi:hypothetical protein
MRWGDDPVAGTFTFFLHLCRWTGTMEASLERNPHEFAWHGSALIGPARELNLPPKAVNNPH